MAKDEDRERPLPTCWTDRVLDEKWQLNYLYLIEHALRMAPTSCISKDVVFGETLATNMVTMVAMNNAGNTMC